MRALASLAVACSLLLAPWLARPGQAQQPQPMMVIAINECAEPLTLLVSAVPASGKRETYGWFSLPPKSDKMLFLPNTAPLMHNVTLPFYIYAKNADESMTWTAGDLVVQWEGRSYNMQQRDLQIVDAGPMQMRAVAFACG